MELKELIMVANLPSSVGEIKRSARKFCVMNRIRFSEAKDLAANSFGFSNYKAARLVMIKIKRPPEGGLKLRRTNKFKEVKL